MTQLFKVLANGDDITDVINDRLIQIVVTDDDGVKNDTLEIRIDDRDGIIEIPSSDVLLEVSFFDDKKAHDYVPMGVFSGLETNISFGPRLISFKATSFSLRKDFSNKKTRSFDDISISDLVATIASDNGYDPLVDDDLAAVIYEHVDQTNESDWQLLHRIAQDNDAFVKAPAGKIIFAKRGGKNSLKIKELLPVVTLDYSQLIVGDLKITDKGNLSSVTARWQDKAGAELVVETVGSGKPTTEIPQIFKTAKDALRRANAKLNAARRRGVKLNFDTGGNVELMSQSTAVLENVRGRVDGAYTIQRVVHSITKKSGYTARVEATL